MEIKVASFTRRLSLILWLPWAAWAAHGPQPQVVLTTAGPKETVPAGSRINVWLYALNPASQPVSWSFPKTMACRLISPQGAFDVSAGLPDPAQMHPWTIAPGTFVQQQYALLLPEVCAGDVTVEFRDPKAGQLELQVQNPPPPTATNQPVKTGLLSFLKGRKTSGADGSYNPETFFKEHIFGYEPFYFIAGPESPNAKFQISFKYRLLNEHGWLAQKAPWLTGLHLAYTQTSLWDWNAPSAPFYDSSYKPEFLYYWPRVFGGTPTNWYRLDLQGGAQHESNGKSGANSRSLNIVYLRPTLTLGPETGLQLSFTPRVWGYVGDLSDNPDIADYRGYADLRVVLGWSRGLQVSALGRLGKDGGHGSAQIDVSYPLMQPPSGSFSIYLFAQYFTGYGESLLGYKETSNIFRAGIALYR